jgi:hypothetical protein
MKVEDPKSTYFCTCNGTIALKGHELSEQVVSAQHHAGSRFVVNDQGKIESKPAGMDYHDDASLEELASKIGVKIDWSKLD